MSYSIIYDKQFIRTADNEYYIPIILAGDSNVYDMFNNKRARDWQTYKINNKIFLTKEEILSFPEKVRKEEIENINKKIKKEKEEQDSIYTPEPYDDKSFGYFTGISIRNNHPTKTTFEQFKGIFKDGIKKALTVEQLTEKGVFVYVETDFDLDDEKKKFGIESFSRKVSNEKDLIDAVKECEERFKGTKITTKVSINVSEEILKLIKRELFPRKKKEKKTVTVDKYYTIVVEEENEADKYLAKRTKNGYKYHPTSPYLKFADKTEAEKRVKKYNEKYSQKHKVKEINRPANVKVPA